MLNVKMFKKRIKYPYITAYDKTILYCPEVQANYNYRQYLREKRKYFIGSIIFFLSSVILLLIIKNDTFQTILSVIAGGFISTIVWFVTVSYKDRVEYQVYTIDKCLSEIDHQLYIFHTPVYFVDPSKGHIEMSDINDPIMMFMHILRYANMLHVSKIIYAEKLKLKNFTMNDLNVSDFTVWATNIIAKKEFTNEDIKKIQDINIWNYHYIERHLLELKDQLIRYKSYVYSKNPPKIIVSDERFMNTNDKEK